MMKRFKSLIAASALALTALVSGAQILSTNPPQHVFISDTTLMWSCQDPFAFGQVSNLLALAAAQDSSNAVFSAALGSLSQGGSSLSAAFTVHTGAYAAASAAQASSNALMASAISAASNALDARVTASTNALGAALSAADLSLGARITAGTNAVWGWAYDADTLLRSGILAASNTSLMAWTASTNAQGVAASAASSAASAVISATDSFNAAAQASSNAAYSAAASTGAVGIAGNAVAIASSAAADAAAAIGLASTYFAHSTSAVAVASSAALDASNAVAVANAIRAQNEYPSSLWTPSVTVPQDMGVFGWLDLTSGGAPTAVVHHVVWPTNAHWCTAGAAVLTNALTSDTNALVTAYFPTNAVVRRAPDGSLPFPLPVITGASDSWEWDQAMGVFGVTNRFILTAVTNAGGSVSVYLGMTNVYSGYLYASTNLSEAAYTGLVSVVMQPAVLGVTGTVTLFRARDPATTNSSALASANSLGLVSYALEQEALERAQEDTAIRGEIIAATGAIPASAVSPSQVTNIAEFVSGVAATSLSNLVTETSAQTTQELASVASLYTLMSTSQVTKVWESTNVWWTFTTNVATRHAVTSGTRWRALVSYSLYENGGGDLLQGPTNFVTDIPFPLTEPGSWAGFTATVLGEMVDLVSSAPIYANLFRNSEYAAEFFPRNSAFNLPQADGETYGEGMWLLTEPYVETNETVFYMQTNLVPPETWSRTDMSSWLGTNTYTYSSWNTFTTNWMADGNAGQVWVTSLSYDSANVVMNTHLHPAGTAHDSRYVKLTGGVASNVTLIGTVTLGTESRTNWPAERAAVSIVRYAPTSSVSVVVNATNSAYYVSVASAGVVLSNNVSGLTVGAGEDASWSVFADVSDWTATNLAFAADIVWRGYAPICTVTGRYEFAFTRRGGVTYGRQAFPNPCCEWVPLTFGSANSPNQGNQTRNVTLLGAAASNAYCLAGHPFQGVPSIVAVTYICGGSSNPDLRLWINQSYQAALPGYTENLPLRTVYDPGVSVKIAVPATNTVADVVYYLRLTTASFPTGNVSLHSPRARRMNELEIKAFDAGWRP